MLLCAAILWCKTWSGIAGREAMAAACWRGSLGDLEGDIAILPCDWSILDFLMDGDLGMPERARTYLSNLLASSMQFTFVDVTGHLAQGLAEC